MASFKVSLKGLVRLSAGCGGRILVRCLIGFVRVAASLYFVMVSKHLIDVATGVSEGSLKDGVLILASVMAVQVITGLAASRYESLILVRTSNGLRLALFNHVMRGKWRGKEKYHSGDTVNRLENDINVVTDMICTRVPDIIITLCQLVAASLYMLHLSDGLLWLLLGLMTIAVLGSRLFFGRIRELTSAIRTEESRIQSCMQDNLVYRVLALTLYGPARVSERLDSMQDVVYEKNRSRLNLSLVARGFMSFGFSAGYLATFVWGVTGIRHGTTTFGTMTAFLSLVAQIQGPIANLSRHIPAFIHSLTSVDRLEELYGLETEETAIPLYLDSAPEIRVDNVSYGYSEGEHSVLDHFSCVFPAGRITAVMGPTGAGKSTLIRLILALLEPTSGEIMLHDGNKVHRVSPHTRCNFIYVPQGNTMMSGTVRENFLMVNPDATVAQMETAVRAAAADFILDMPAGLDTVCGEVGAGLSEGQSQRLAIARSLLHPGNVLILDESTSSLDAETENRLLENLSSLYEGKRTVIFVTHRENVAAKASAIIRLE